MIPISETVAKYGRASADAPIWTLAIILLNFRASVSYALRPAKPTNEALRVLEVPSTGWCRYHLRRKALLGGRFVRIPSWCGALDQREAAMAAEDRGVSASRCWPGTQSAPEALRSWSPPGDSVRWIVGGLSGSRCQSC